MSIELLDRCLLLRLSAGHADQVEVDLRFIHLQLSRLALQTNTFVAPAPDQQGAAVPDMPVPV